MATDNERQGRPDGAETQAMGDPRAAAALMNEASRGSAIEVLGIRFEEASPARMVATMPITATVKQPMGVLHGGISVTLAETVASIGTWLALDHATEECYGLEINCNHLRTKREGLVRAIATPLHRGRRNWVWDIRIQDEDERLVAVARCTMAVVPKRGE